MSTKVQHDIKLKAYIYDPLWESLVTPAISERLASAGIVPVVVTKPADIRSNRAMLDDQGAKVLCVNPDYVKWKLEPSAYSDIPNLRAILGEATSFSWIDMQYATDSGIPVCNIRDFSTNAVADWAVMMMQNLARRVPLLIKDGFPLDFDADFSNYRGIELGGKKAGVIGIGNIGSAIARRCEGLGMEVSYWSRNKDGKSRYNYKELAALFKTCDVIFPCLPLNEETKRLITDTMLHSMKKESILVSIVHDLYDSNVVLDMVKRGDLFGYGFEAKPESFASYEGNVWAAPEYAWVTDGSMRNMMDAWVDNMVDAATGKFPNRVN